MKELKIRNFERYMQNRASKGTIAAYVYALRRWASWLNGKQTNAQSAQEYIDYITNAQKSPSTVGVRAHAIMRYFRWKGVQVRLDCPTIRMGEPEYLTMPQIDKVLAACTTVLERTLIVVLFDTAVRISELLNIELDDIDWDNGFISVMRKGGRKEEVNISTKALTALGEWLNARSSRSKKVFMGLSYYDAWATIKGIGKRTGIPLHPHALRHSRAIMMLKSGTPPHIVQRHLGHASIATTMNIYGRFRAVDIKDNIPAW